MDLSNFIILRGSSSYNKEEDEKKRYSMAKTPIPSKKGWTDLNTNSNVSVWMDADNWLGFVIPQGLLVVDVNDNETGKMFYEVLRSANYKCVCIKTPNVLPC